MEVKPGYKQTEVGVIPQDWEAKPLGSIAQLKNGYAFKSTTYTSLGQFKVITIANVQDGYMDNSDCNKVASIPSDVQPHQKLQRQDILISMTGNVGRVCRVNDDDCLLNQRVGKLVATGVDDGLLLMLLSQRPFIMAMTGKAKGGAQGNLSVSDITEYQFAVPPTLAEQRAIAAALSDVDALIGALDQLIAKKRDIKQAAMQQLLGGQHCLPDFHREWQETTLGEIGDCVIGLTYKPENVVEHGLLVLRASNVQNGQLSYEDNVYVDVKVPERLITRPGDILICVRNGSRALIGKCARIGQDGAGLTFGAFMSVYRTKHSRFIFHAFQGNDVQRQIHENIGATINQITNKDLKGFRVNLPPEDEQDAIADVLSDMDAEIAALEARRDKTRALKQGMMQELLTGRIRLL